MSDLGTFGVWWSGSWTAEGGAPWEAAAELEAMGYRTLWSSGGFSDGFPSHFARLLDETTSVRVASGIVSIWKVAPDVASDAVAALETRHRGRFVFGLGASHAPLVENYTRPYSRVVEYLDALDAAPGGVRAQHRVLAALGPRMLTLAARRALGAHPYFVPVEHTVRARQTLGTGPLLAPEVAVVLATDPSEARGLARRYAAVYLGLPNYTTNLRAFGFGDEDLAGGGSDRLIDAVVPWGDAARVADRVREHVAAGADHVCIQVVADPAHFPLPAYRELAGALSLAGR
ncbi:MAG TPA: LLM class F420-dependent oxidoreductase [Acidimicrobiales bacterium]|nr:LLM class F420-dependent oxidoreductase [Acidimicrobiales bacterium]